MAIHQRLKNWFRQKSRSRKNGQEETVAVPEVHTGKVRHEAADSTPEADCPIHYDNVAIPEIHIHSRKNKDTRVHNSRACGSGCCAFLRFLLPNKNTPCSLYGQTAGGAWLFRCSKN